LPEIRDKQEVMGNHTAIEGTDETTAVQVPQFEVVPSKAQLSEEELRRLEVCEKTIREGMGTFVAVGTALMEIRDARLYRQTHPSFGEYVKSVLALSRPRAYELIDSAQVMNDLSALGDLPALPQNEAQARELRRWRTPQERAKKWKAVLKRAGDQPLTAQFIRRALTPPGKRTPAPDPAQSCLNRLKKLALKSRSETSALKLIARLEELFSDEETAEAKPKNEMWLPGLF
jgi:hypothetical protein